VPTVANVAIEDQQSAGPTRTNQGFGRQRPLDPLLHLLPHRALRLRCANIHSHRNNNSDYDNRLGE